LTVSTTPTWKFPAELLVFVLLELSIADVSNSMVGASADRWFALEFIGGRIRASKPWLNSPFVRMLTFPELFRSLRNDSFS